MDLISVDWAKVESDELTLCHLTVPQPILHY